MAFVAWQSFKGAFSGSSAPSRVRRPQHALDVVARQLRPFRYPALPACDLPWRCRSPRPTGGAGSASRRTHRWRIGSRQASAKNRETLAYQAGRGPQGRDCFLGSGRRWQFMFRAVQPMHSVAVCAVRRLPATRRYAQERRAIASAPSCRRGLPGPSGNPGCRRFPPVPAARLRHRS